MADKIFQVHVETLSLKGSRGFGDLDSLINSISVIGITDPIEVVVADGKYKIKTGFRRVAAAKLLGLNTIPAIRRES